MSVQRWKDMWYGEDHGELLPREDGEYVLYADHERALAEARLGGFDEGCRATEANYVKGYAAGLQAARDAVAALIHSSLCDCESCWWKADALDAINALIHEGSSE